MTVLSSIPKLNDPPAFAIRFLVFHGGVNMALEYLSLSTTACAQIFSTALIAWKAWCVMHDALLHINFASLISPFVGYIDETSLFRFPNAREAPLITSAFSPYCAS